MNVKVREGKIIGRKGREGKRNKWIASYGKEREGKRERKGRKSK